MSTNELLDDTLNTLKECGYTIGDAAISDKGHVLILVGDKFMTHAEIYELASTCGEDDD